MKGGRAVIERMKEATGDRTDAELATRLNIPAGTVASWRHRDRVPMKHVIAFAGAGYLNLDWLLTGVGRRDSTHLTTVDPNILAIAIEQAEVAARQVQPNNRAEAAELAEIIAAFYSHANHLYLEILATAKMPRGEVLKLIRRVNNLPEHRRQYILTDEGLLDADEVTKEALVGLRDVLADLMGRKS